MFPRPGKENKLKTIKGFKNVMTMKSAVFKNKPYGPMKDSSHPVVIKGAQPYASET